MKYVDICLSRKKFLDASAQEVSKCLIGSKAVAEGQKVKAIYLDFADKSIYCEKLPYLGNNIKLIVSSIEGKIRYFKTQYTTHVNYSELSELEFFNIYTRYIGGRDKLEVAIEKYFLFSNIKAHPQKNNKSKFKI